jgi:hypothetical protein
MAKEHGGGVLGNLGSLFSGIFGGGSPAGPAGVLNTLLGPGANAVAASLSRALGFNVAPLLAMAAPALLGAVSKMVGASSLDPSSLASALRQESDAFAADPANKATMDLVNTARASGEKAEALVRAYGSDWPAVAAGPAAALFMIASGDPSGPVGAIKEAKAANDQLAELARGAAPDSLIGAAFGGGITPEMLAHLKSVASNKDQLLDAVRRGMAAVRAHSPDEAAAYRTVLMNVAEAAAKAAKEGGFLGIGGTLVSEGEQKALDALEAALG